MPALALEPVPEQQVTAAWENFVTGVPVATSAVSKVVLSSWQRSRRAGVQPSTRHAPLVSGGEDALEQLRRCNRDLLWAAQGLFLTSAHLLARSGSIMLLTDPHGVVLEVAGDMRTLEAAQGVQLVAGANWHETVVGTNGIGTALAMRQPVQVHAAEHFGAGIKSWTCAAAPIFLPGSEEMLGVIDISGPPSTYQRGNLVLALAAARQMEAVLADRANREHVQLLEASMRFGASTPAEAMLVLDRNAKLIFASGALPGLNCHVGVCLPGLEAGRSAHEWARCLPPGLRGEWLHPVRVDGVTIGAVVWVPKFVRSTAAARRDTAHTAPPHGTAPHTAHPHATPAADTAPDPASDYFATLRGRSPALLTAIERARLLGSRRVAVLIQGETGVGKELFARAMHGNDSRSGPYFTFNCGATSKELIGSELFGHVRGAYTGASPEGRAGWFELAHGGTLCLDEVGELPLDLQPVLLRCLEEGVVSRLGESRLRRVDVRLLAMTHRDLLKEVETGRFRRDLYHRISVTCVRVPPLCEREDDIDLLVEHFNHSLAARHGVASRHFGPAVMNTLRAYGWPGNVRELRNVVEGLLLTSDCHEVSCSELPAELRCAAPRSAVAAAGDGPAAGPLGTASLQDTERQAIVQAINSTHGNLTRAARALGVSRSTLYRKVERYRLQGIVRHDGGSTTGLEG